MKDCRHFIMFSSNIVDVQPTATSDDKCAASRCIKNIELVLVRHGETTANRDNILQGQCDFPLTEKGIQGAKEVGKALKSESWDLVYSSDLKRAYDTCSLMLHEREFDSQCNIIQTPLLRELSFGIREMLPRGTKVSEAKEIVAKKLSISPHEVTDNAETYSQLTERQISFLDSVFNDIGSTEERKKVLCVSHGAFIRHFIASNCPSIDCPKIANCSVTIIKIMQSVDINDATGSINPPQTKISYTFTIDSPNDLNRTEHLSESVRENLSP